MQVEDGAAVIFDRQDGDDAGGEVGQVGAAAQMGKVLVLVDQRLDRNRGSDLAALDQLGDQAVDAAVGRVLPRAASMFTAERN